MRTSHHGDDDRMITYTHDHIHLFSADPGSASRFYTEMFGAEMVAVRPDGRVDVRLGGQMLFISPFDDGGKAGPKSANRALDHFALLVNDLDSAVRELKAKGVAFTQGPQTIRPGVSIAFLSAPDGVEVELLQRT
jgi:lactoylglutathione lyase